MKILQFSAIASLACLVAFPSLAPAQEAVTDPVGVVTKTIAPGNGVTKSISLLSLPLLNPSTSLAGAVSGNFSQITSTTITDSSAGWAIGELSNPTNPKLLLVTSGNAEGLILYISTNIGNTATTLTIDSSESNSLNLLSLGINAGENGDSYTILDCDTLITAFGDPATSGIISGDSLSQSDHISIFENGAWNDYFFRSSSGTWVRNVRGFPNANNIRIKPSTGVMFNRLGNTSLDLVTTGNVPMNSHIRVINNSGITLFGAFWPVPTTLLELGLQSLSNWQSSPDGSGADIVTLRDGAAWKSYFWNGTSWVERRRGFPAANTIEISSASSIIISRQNNGPGSVLLDSQRPF